MKYLYHGHPIIDMFYQIENEYGDIEGAYGQQGKDYVRWAAKMAVGLGAGVPWVMCKQVDAPEFIVNSFHLAVSYFCFLLILRLIMKKKHISHFII